MERAPPRRVDIWRWRLERGAAELLSADELARAGRFVFERDRRRYVAARARLRSILSGYLGAEPAALRFRYGPHGRPEIDGISFNLSHSADLALLAVSRETIVGADVEQVRAIEDSVARTHFAPEEYASLRATPPGGRMQAFYRCWTRKEAYLKARGTGLSTDLASFEVTLDARPRLIRCCDGAEARWTLRDLPAPEGFAAALAARTDGAPLRLTFQEG